MKKNDMTILHESCVKFIANEQWTKDI